jgi:Flp pilus assembly protein TadD
MRAPGQRGRIGLVAAVAVTGAVLTAAMPTFAADRSDPLHVDPLALTDEMRAFIHQRVAPGLRPAQRLSALIDAVFAEAPEGLGIEYGHLETRTAADTFAHRSGNCISFTNLLVAMARELGLAAYYAEVDQVLARDMRGEVLINNKHMIVELEIENAVVHVDLVPDAGEYHAVRRISDRRAAAHYFNNLGVERLVEEGGEASLPRFHRALELAPDLAAAWVNLGVALRRLERFPQAETAYRQAIDIDPSELAALSNLAFLYEAWGRSEEAAVLHDRVEHHRRRNPFYLYRLGGQSLAAGRLEQAVDHFRNAVKRDPEVARFHFALGDALYRAGDLDRAESSLRRAVELAEGDDQREHYRRALQAVITLRSVQGDVGQRSRR